MIASTRNSWENPALWWLSGVLLESNGELDMAWQSYRKAAAIKPGNPFFAADAARADVGASTPRAGKSKLVVVYDQGFVPMRESLEIPVPLYTGFAIQIPKYPSVAFVENRVSVAGASGAKEASPAVDVRSLAARDLKEQLPGIITRNVTRAAVQAGAQAAVNAAYVTLSIPDNDGTLLAKEEEAYASVMLELNDTLPEGVAENFARNIATALGNKTTENIIFLFGQFSGLGSQFKSNRMYIIFTGNFCPDKNSVIHAKIPLL